VSVAKHGNRSFTSKSGSADVLEALGIDISLPPELTTRVLASVGLTFLFAPAYHPAMRHVGPVRKELGVTTIMNLLGPLANPAGVVRQVIGVADEAKAPLMAEALAALGARHALVLHAAVGMDEISPSPNMDWNAPISMIWPAVNRPRTPAGSSGSSQGKPTRPYDAPPCSMRPRRSTFRETDGRSLRLPTERVNR
jgi:hypothetical protein